MKSFQKSIEINASPEAIFQFMDDIENTGMHMMKSNSAMMGSKLTLEWITEQRTGVKTRLRWKGNVVCFPLDFTVEVTKWIFAKEKAWETIGDVKLIILNWYRMYLKLTPLPNGATQTELGIFYTIPGKNILAFLLSKRYATLCVESMLNDTSKHFINFKVPALQH
jgi:hypothetical protein